ncbi:MAG: alpha/beta fold hydrolase, partial [Thermodesulfovibrionales bacterium]|nr:alpha/beta fold hydrolase [Thermodesulfovibrionales bacterium]
MGMIFEGVSFKSGRGTIRGWYVPPATKGDHVPPAVVIAHGWSSNAAKLLRTAKHLSHEGFSVLLYDARAHGASDWDGPMTVFRLSEDVVAAVDHLCAREDIDTGRIGVLGHSMGGSASILAASRDERIRAVVSCAAPADTVRMTVGFLRRRRLPVWPFLGI